MKKLQPLFRTNVVFATCLLIYTPQIEADEAAGCIQPQCYPNPTCSPDLVNGTTCIKWIYPFNVCYCGGTPPEGWDLLCWKHKSTGTETTYTKPNTGDCSCSSDGWEFEAEKPNRQYNTDYNNDTGCSAG